MRLNLTARSTRVDLRLGFVSKAPQLRRISLGGLRQAPLHGAWDLVVAGFGALAVFVELALVRPWGRKVPRQFIVFCAWAGTGLLLVGTAFSVARTIYLVAKDRFTFSDMGIVEPWFYLGTILFGISTWQFCRHRGVGAV